MKPPLTRLLTPAAVLSSLNSRRASILFDEAKSTAPVFMLPMMMLMPRKKLFSSVDVYGTAELLPDMNDGELSHEPIHRPLLKTIPSPILSAIIA